MENVPIASCAELLKTAFKIIPRFDRPERINDCSSSSGGDSSFPTFCVKIYLVLRSSIIDISVNNGQNDRIFHKETNRHTRDIVRKIISHTNSLVFVLSLTMVIRINRLILSLGDFCCNL